MPNPPQTAEIAWSWASILKLAITTGFFTATISQFVAWLKEEIQRKGKDRQTGKVLALSLADLLTSYALECAARARSNRYYSDRCDRLGMYTMPVLPSLQEPDLGWAVIPPRIAAAIRDFRNVVREATLDVDECNEIYGPPEAVDTATGRYIYLGYKAWLISNRLRKYYGFGRYSGEANFVEELRKHYLIANPGTIRRFWRSLRMHKLRASMRR